MLGYFDKNIKKYIKNIAVYNIYERKINRTHIKYYELYADTYLYTSFRHIYVTRLIFTTVKEKNMINIYLQYGLKVINTFKSINKVFSVCNVIKEQNGETHLWENQDHCYRQTPPKRLLHSSYNIFFYKILFF